MEGQTRCLIFDPFAGISGDMILGAVLDLGLSIEWLQETVRALPIDVGVSASRVARGAIDAHAVEVEVRGPQPHRRLADILEIIDAAPLAASTRLTAGAAFRRLADVEGHLHGIPPEDVHFHEVGAADAIVDVVGAAAAIVELGVQDCFTRPVAVGRGWVRAAHGPLPLPAPATLRLLEGLPVIDSDLEGELTTPTGAVILATLTAGRGVPGPFVIRRSGFGAGSRNPSTHPNCLRVVLADLDAGGRLSVIQADLDDMSPEYLPPLLESLTAAGAIDVWTHPVQMKKGRTGIRVEALVEEQARHEVARALLQGSTTLGLRFFRVEREVLPRGTKTIEWRGLQIRVKTSVAPDGQVRCKPEYDDVLEAARVLGVPPWRALAEIERLLSTKSEC
jgi:uncharacterized protein (TIGR00299 family) protein